MRGTGFVVAIATMAAFVSCARASEQDSWRPVLPDKHVVVFIDQVRTHKSGDVATTRAMLVMPGPSPSPFGVIGSIESEEQFDCSKRMHQTRAVDFISMSGVLVHRETKPGPNEFVPTNNIGDYIMKAACNGEFASGDTFSDQKSANEFGRAWGKLFENPPTVLMHANATIQHYPPPPTLVDLTLPEGRLGGVGGHPGQVAFLDMDHIRHDKDQVFATAFWVYAAGSLPGNPNASQSVSHFQLDCKAGIYFDLGGLEYDQNDVLILWTPREIASQTLPPSSVYATMSKFLCDGVAIPPENIVIGHTAALASAKQVIGTWATHGAALTP